MDKRVPKIVKEAIIRVVHSLPDPSSCEGKVVTFVGQGFSGDLFAKDGRWRTRDKKFKIRLVSEPED